MTRVILIILILLCGAASLHGQVVDSTAWRAQGEPVFVTGESIVFQGALMAAAGAGTMLLALSPQINRPVPEGQFNENWVPLLIYMMGGSALIVGAASSILVGVPITIAGCSLMQCDVPWTEARYDTRGPGIILEGGYFDPDILQARAAIGYHFNSHLFLGCGVAPGVWLDKSYRANYNSRLSLPVYADFRWSIINRIISPYIGLSAGMEFFDDPFSPYLGAEIGTRMRMNRQSTSSFWSAIAAEVAGGYGRIGVKMGYSF